MKQYIFKILLFLATCCILLTSCNLEEVSPDSYDEDTFWISAKTAEAGLVGCYAPLKSNGLYGNATPLWEETATPNAYNYHDINGWNRIALGTQSSDLGVFSQRWTAAYTGIGRCNLLINNIHQNKELSLDRIEVMKAEARFLRALYYHILTVYYDKAPLIFDNPSLSQWNEARTERSTIVDFILAELDEVSKILPKSQPAASLGRPTSGAALALKAKILLFEASPLFNSTNDKEIWRKAANAAEAVINTKTYDLSSNYRQLFSLSNENSKECIFDVQYIRESGYGSSFDVVLRQYNTCAPTHNFVESYWMADGKPREESEYKDADVYDNLDPRFYHTIVYPGSTFMGEKVDPAKTTSTFTISQTGYTFKKYSIYDVQAVSSEDKNLGENMSPINYMVIRYADVLLWYAEAKNELNELTQDVWDQTIAKIRSRAGYSGAATYPGNDYNTLLKHIRYERRIEFAGEGYHYNDIRRWKIAEQVMPETIKKYNEVPIVTRSFNPNRDYWWSIPSSQIEIAPNLLPNNPGW